MLRSILPLYRELIDAGLKILVYSGDVDAIVPGEQFTAVIAELGGRSEALGACAQGCGDD